MILLYFIISILVPVSKSAQRRPLHGETSNLAIRLLDTMQDFESRRGLPQPCSAEAAEVAIGPVEFTALFFRSRSRDGKHACASQFHPSLGTRRACTFRGQTPRASGRDLPPSPSRGGVYISSGAAFIFRSSNPLALPLLQIFVGFFITFRCVSVPICTHNHHAHAWIAGRACARWFSAFWAFSRALFRDHFTELRGKRNNSLAEVLKTSSIERF